MDFVLSFDYEEPNNEEVQHVWEKNRSGEAISAVTTIVSAEDALSKARPQADSRETLSPITTQQVRLTMPDDLKRRRPEDPNTISLKEPWEVNYWTQELGVSITILRTAVNAVGHSVIQVRAWLRKNGYK